MYNKNYKYSFAKENSVIKNGVMSSSRELRRKMKRDMKKDFNAKKKVEECTGKVLPVTLWEIFGFNR